MIASKPRLENGPIHILKIIFQNKQFQTILEPLVRLLMSQWETDHDSSLKHMNNCIKNT